MLPNYSGIFTVIGHTKLKNYWLENHNKKKLAMAYPRSRLKEVHITGDENSGYTVEYIIDQTFINNTSNINK